MGQHRAIRVAEEIRKEVSQMIGSQLKDPRIGFVTITSVEVTNDLRHAKIFLSTLGSEEARKETFTALNKAKGFVRTELSGRLKLRCTPELVFVFDESVEHGAKILKLLNEVNATEGVQKSEQ